MIVGKREVDSFRTGFRHEKKVHLFYVATFAAKRHNEARLFTHFSARFWEGRECVCLYLPVAT